MTQPSSDTVKIQSVKSRTINRQASFKQQQKAKHKQQQQQQTSKNTSPRQSTMRESTQKTENFLENKQMHEQTTFYRPHEKKK